ncbi:GntR family transcriptional regulator [Corynebacterium tapiri]|nr:GntR family transcriptional regulator [Corynebacterium tapiri]
MATSPSRPSKADRVVEHVRRCVREGTMTPNQWYSAYQLADELEISRSPAREGLLRLEEAGLIRFTHNRGFQVIPTTGDDVAEIFTMRIALEVPAARRAAALLDGDVTALRETRAAMQEAADRNDEAEFFRLDRHLHALINSAGGGQRTANTVEQLRNITQLIGTSTAAEDLRTLSAIVQEHDPIIDAIAARDRAAAGSFMLEHLSLTGRMLVAQAMGVSAHDEAAEQTWRKHTTGFLHDTGAD